MKSIMEINKETALRLWNQQFGKKQKAFDFSGREIAKAAYNSRGSKFGWNIDHILPQSRGGKTADHNLICCHILSNDEKSDHFPAFKANNRNFEIRKKQNHYEIVEKTAANKTTGNKSNNSEQKNSNIPNMLDVSDGLRYWEKCCEKYTPVYCGFVKLKIEFSQSDNDLLDSLLMFIEKIFEPVSIIKISGNGYYRTKEVTIFKNISTSRSSAQNLLDECILLNTYSDFFQETEDCKFKIYCGMKNYNSVSEAWKNFEYDVGHEYIRFSDDLTVDSFIKDHTNAKNSIEKSDDTYRYSYQNEFSFNMTFKKLEKDLQKRLN